MPILFYGDRLRSAREARGLSAVSVSELLEVSRQAVSQYEVGKSIPSDAIFEKICLHLNLAPAFFQRKPIDEDFSPVFYRSLSSATKTARLRAERRFSWLKELVLSLKEWVSFPLPNLPVFEVPENPLKLTDNEITQFAQMTRRHWGLGDGPIPNVCTLLENNGVIVSRQRMDSEKLDAFSQWSEVIGAPAIILNSDKESAARSRFDACHELGHLLLHRHVPLKEINKKAVFKKMEDQAHLFAGAFLMPEKSFSADLLLTDLDHLKSLKLTWKVAIGAMIIRASQIGRLTEERERRLWINRTQRGWRTREPFDDIIPPEQPTYLKKCFELLMSNGVFTADYMRDNFGFGPNEVESLCSLPRGTMTNATDVEPVILKLHQHRVM